MSKIQNGLDVLVEQEFRPLENQRVGLVINHSSVTGRGVHILDLLKSHPNLNVVALYSPEHGLRGTAEERVRSGYDKTTGLPVHSLYDKDYRPNPKTLEGVETLVFDIQDIGTRFYTYWATMGTCMEEAGKAGIRFVVLDRPNPIGGLAFDGPFPDEDLLGTLVNYVSMPTIHGLTTGELVKLLNTEYGVECEVDVIAMRGWKREMCYDQTGLPWVNPSPNIRSLEEALLYPMVAQTEMNKEISVGRGTDRPFEYVGAPWIDKKAFAEELKSRDIPGLWASPINFIPSSCDIGGRPNVSYPHVEQVCQGVRLAITGRSSFEPVAAGIHLIHALKKLYPEKYETEDLRVLIGAKWVLDAVEEQRPAESIIQQWREDPRFREFAAIRNKVLMY